EARGRWFWCAWAVVLGVAIAFEVSAQIFLQARAPLLWTLLMALTACGSVAGIVFACRATPSTAKAAAP
ncbi:MAG: hypothetical protein AAGD12_12415, partial [Pseudomonadota bacterium]